MPTVRQSIRYAFLDFIRLYGVAARRMAKVIIAIFAIALLLEIFLFNINFFTSANYNTVSLNDKLNLQETADGHYKLTAVNHTLEFSHLNTEIHNIRLDFDAQQPAQELTVKIKFTDEAHKTYFDSTEYTAGVPAVSVATNSDQSEYINLNATGLVNSLCIEITGDKINYPIKLTGVFLNAHHPFDFNTSRFLIVTGILGLIYLFRPRSSIYKTSIVGKPKKTKAIIVAAVAVEVYLVATFLFLGSNLVGIATPYYNTGSWDGKSLVNTFDVAGDNAQQYAKLAKAFVQGQVYLEDTPPQWLQDMDTPYDKGARDELQKQTGEPYLFDVAYYQGHYYVYFGVVPALLFYVPYYLLTGGNFPTALGILIAVCFFIMGCSALLDRFARYHFKQVSLGLYLLLQISLISCCGVLYLVKFPTFYSLPIMCGLAFSVWGLYFWMRGRASEKPEKYYLAGSLCMALVAGCRPQLLALSLLAFPLFWRLYIAERRLFTPRGAREFACLIGPYVVVAAGLMWYNRIRFGSPFDFGANYNLTVNDMTKRGLNSGRVPPALFSYFFQPPNVAGTFPFLQATSFSTTYMGQTIKETTFGGIFACMPLLWVLIFSKSILKMRIKARSTRTVMGVVVVLLITGVLVALLDAEMAGILQRYYADFSFMFLAAAVLLIFIVNENISSDSPLRSPFIKALIFFAFLSVFYSILLCFVPETGWYSDVYAWAYQNLIESVQFWT